MLTHLLISIIESQGNEFKYTTKVNNRAKQICPDDREFSGM